MDTSLVRPIEMLHELQCLGVASIHVNRYHGQFVGHLIQRYSRIVDRQIPNDDSALLEFAVDALIRWMGSDSISIFSSEGVIYRTAEIFNWRSINWLAYQLEEDNNAIDKLFESIRQKYYWKFENVDEACAAFALGILSLEALHIVISKLKGLEIRNRKWAYAVEFIRTIAESFYIMDEFLGEEWTYVTVDNVDQIESIVAEINLIDLDALEKAIKLY